MRLPSGRTPIGSLTVRALLQVLHGADDIPLRVRERQHRADRFDQEGFVLENSSMLLDRNRRCSTSSTEIEHWNPVIPLPVTGS